MARRIFVSVSLWQLLASVPVIYCLISKRWITSPKQEETRGLFGICRKGNSSCKTDDCAPCDPNATVVSCGDFGDDREYTFCLSPCSHVVSQGWATRFGLRVTISSKIPPSADLFFFRGIVDNWRVFYEIIFLIGQ